MWNVCWGQQLKLIFRNLHSLIEWIPTDSAQCDFNSKPPQTFWRNNLTKWLFGQLMISELLGKSYIQYYINCHLLLIQHLEKVISYCFKEYLCDCPDCTGFMAASQWWQDMMHAEIKDTPPTFDFFFFYWFFDAGQGWHNQLGQIRCWEWLMANSDNDKTNPVCKKKKKKKKAKWCPLCTVRFYFFLAGQFHSSLARAISILTVFCFLATSTTFPKNRNPFGTRYKKLEGSLIKDGPVLSLSETAAFHWSIQKKKKNCQMEYWRQKFIANIRSAM